MSRKYSATTAGDQKDRFRNLTGMEPTAANVKKYFSSRKNLAFYNKLKEQHHGSSVEFWTAIADRVAANIALAQRGYLPNKLNHCENELLNMLLNLGFRAYTTSPTLDDPKKGKIEGFPDLIYINGKYKIWVRYYKRQGCGINIAFREGNKDAGFDEWLCSENNKIYTVYRMAKFLIDYVIKKRIYYEAIAESTGRALI